MQDVFIFIFFMYIVSFVVMLLVENDQFGNNFGGYSIFTEDFYEIYVFYVNI